MIYEPFTEENAPWRLDIYNALNIEINRLIGEFQNRIDDIMLNGTDMSANSEIEFRLDENMNTLVTFPASMFRSRK